MKYGMLKVLLAAPLLALVSGCVPSAQVSGYTPAQLSVLQAELVGEGIQRAGTFTDAFNEYTWRCNAMPLKLKVSIDRGNASLKLRVHGRIYRATAAVNNNGHIDAFTELGDVFDDGGSYLFHSKVELRAQRARVMFTHDRSGLGGCSTDWFRLTGTTESAAAEIDPGAG